MELVSTLQKLTSKLAEVTNFANSIFVHHSIDQKVRLKSLCCVFLNWICCMVGPKFCDCTKKYVSVDHMSEPMLSNMRF